jgi:hypothetical protein
MPITRCDLRCAATAVYFNEGLFASTPFIGRTPKTFSNFLQFSFGGGLPRSESECPATIQRLFRYDAAAGLNSNSKVERFDATGSRWCTEGLIWLAFPSLTAESAVRMGHPAGRGTESLIWLAFPTLTAESAVRMGHPANRDSKEEWNHAFPPPEPRQKPLKKQKWRPGFIHAANGPFYEAACSLP